MSSEHELHEVIRALHAWLTRQDACVTLNDLRGAENRIIAVVRSAGTDLSPDDLAALEGVSEAITRLKDKVASISTEPPPK